MYIYIYALLVCFKKKTSRLVCIRQHPTVDGRPLTWKKGISDSF